MRRFVSGCGRRDKLVAAILANPVMIQAYQSGIPGNGKPFRYDEAGSLHDVDFMVKDGKRFADSGGWGWAYLKYDAASDTFKPATTADEPPQAHDAKCGLACHTIVKTRDYFFTDYGTRVNGNGPRPVLERHDLGAPGREVVRVRVHFDSGAAFGKHPPKGHWVNERG